MKDNIYLQGIIKYLVGLIMVSTLIFIPAGSIKYWNGWLLISLLFIPMLIVGIFLMFKNKELLKRRLDVKETEKEQKQVIAYSGIMFINGFIIAGLNYRYQWIELPTPVIIIASILFVISYLFYGEVLRENTYLSRTIKTEKNQKVIDTGLYKIVRHPMYASTIILFISMPLILGSIQSLIIFLIYPIIIIKRINNEEKILEKELVGYKEYQSKVKYRIIPFIW